MKKIIKYLIINIIAIIIYFAYYYISHILIKEYPLNYLLEVILGKFSYQYLPIVLFIFSIYFTKKDINEYKTYPVSVAISGILFTIILNLIILFENEYSNFNISLEFLLVPFWIIVIVGYYLYSLIISYFTRVLILKKGDNK